MSFSPEVGLFFVLCWCALTCSFCFFMSCCISKQAGSILVFPVVHPSAEHFVFSHAFTTCMHMYHAFAVCNMSHKTLLGTYRLSDLVGADIGLHVGKNFIESFPERVYPAQIISLLNDHKRLGEKTGSGFYKFDKK